MKPTSLEKKSCTPKSNEHKQMMKEKGVKNTNLHIFSFLNSTELVRTQTVCKDWYELANNGKHWVSFIRHNFLEEFKQSKLNAKEFYIKHLHARTDTFYCVAKIIKVSNKTDPIRTLSDQQLSTAFQAEEKNQLTIFKEYDEALTYADLMSDHHDALAAEHSYSGRYNYPPIFTVTIRDIHRIAKAEKAVPKSSIMSEDKDPCYHLTCFTTPRNNILKIYKATYKAGLTSLKQTGDNKFKIREQQFVTYFTSAQKQLLLSPVENKNQSQEISSNRSCVIS